MNNLLLPSTSIETTQEEAEFFRRLGSNGEFHSRSVLNRYVRKGDSPLGSKMRKNNPPH